MGSPIADEGLKQIAALYTIEDEIRGLAPEARRLVRQARTVPLVAASGTWLKQKRISAPSRFGGQLTPFDQSIELVTFRILSAIGTNQPNPRS